MVARRFAVETRDTDETLQALASAFGPISVRRDEDVFGFRMSGAVSPTLTTTRMWFDASCSTAFDQRDAPDEDQQYIVALPAGRVSITDGTDSIATTGPVLLPETITTDIAGAGFETLALPRAVVRRQAAAIGGEELATGFRFTGASPVDAGAERVWRRTAEHAAALLRLDDLGGSDELIMASTVDLVVTVLLHTFPNTALTRGADRPARRPPYAATRKAVAYIDEHLHEAITLTEIAQAAGLSPRGLEQAFRRDQAVSPMQHLRRRRLDEARRALIETDPTTSTVAAIARRWGFVHLGRFSSTYRAAYGENPNETLRR